MRELEVIWGDVAKISWSLTWRMTLFLGIAGFVGGGILTGILMVLDKFEYYPLAINILTVAIYVPITLLVVKTLLTKQFRGYSIQLVENTIDKDKSVMKIFDPIPVNDPKFFQWVWYGTYALILYGCATEQNNYINPNYLAIYGGITSGAGIPITVASYLYLKPKPSLKIMAKHWSKAILAAGVGMILNNGFTVEGSFIIAFLYFLLLSFFYWPSRRIDSNESGWLDVWKKDRTAYILSMILACLGILFLYFY